MLNFFKQKSKQMKGFCDICFDSEEEPLVHLFGIPMCEGCYHDLLNHMGYKNIDDLLECDKKQLMRFLNKLADRKTS